MVCDAKFYAFVLMMGVFVYAIAFSSGNPVSPTMGPNPTLTDPCGKNCPVTFGYTPFCGSDGKTYPSPKFLDCFASCNLGITKAYDGPCNNNKEVL